MLVGYRSSNSIHFNLCLENISTCEVSALDPEKFRQIEADSYWCMSKLLDGIQDHYTFAQPGIQRMTHKLKELVGRIDGTFSFLFF